MEQLLLEIYADGQVVFIVTSERRGGPILVPGREALRPEMGGTLRVQMLLTDAFGGFGGISRFNCDFLAALNACPYVERVEALPRLIPEPIEEPIPEAVIYNRKSARGKIAFVTEVLCNTMRGNRADLVICGHLNLLPLAWLAARYQRARLALVVYGREAWEPLPHKLTNFLVNRIDAFITISRYSAERFVQWSKVASTRGCVLSPCIDLARFAPGERDPGLVARYGLESSKVMLTVGRLAAGERYKGFDEVIDVIPKLLQRFPALRYLIVGEGSDRARLEAKVKTLGLSQYVIFAGRIPEAEKVAYYNLADVFVMPSYGEGFGIVLIEAAACGIPIVGSSADGARDALLEGRLGRLVDPTNPDELVGAITAAINIQSRTRNKLIETFNLAQFQTRVSHWMNDQAHLAAGE